MAAGLLLVVVLALSVDAPLYRALGAMDDELTDRLGALFFLGDSKWYLVPLGLGLIVLAGLRRRARRRRPRAALIWGTWLCGFGFVAIASSGLLAAGLKYGIGRARPKLIDELGPFAFEPLALEADFAALPSGHANTIVVVGLILSFLWPRWRVLWLAGAAWIAFSRVLIEAHYLSDVVAGALLALLTTFAWREWCARRRLLFERRPDGTIAPRGRRLARWLAASGFRLLAAGTSHRLEPWLRPEAPLVRDLVPAVAIGHPHAVSVAPGALRDAPARAWREQEAAPRAASTGRAAVAVELSVVVPVRDEAPNIAPLVAEIHAALDGEAFEVIYVDDGSRDGTAAALRAARARHPGLRCLRHDESCGQSAAIRTGVLAARGDLIVTLDGDGQNDPADIPRLLAALRDPAAPPHLGMVAGQRRRRRDSWVKRRASAIANGVRGRLLGDRTRDTGCGLKVITRETFLLLPYFDHMHRFLPALVQREGRAVRLVDVAHRPRARGRSKYGILDRLGSGLIDLGGVIWLMRRRRRASISEP